MYHHFKALRYDSCVTRGSHSFTCHPHTNHTCLYSPAARHDHRPLAGTNLYCLVNRGTQVWETCPECTHSMHQLRNQKFISGRGVYISRSFLLLSSSFLPFSCLFPPPQVALEIQISDLASVRCGRKRTYGVVWARERLIAANVDYFC